MWKIILVIIGVAFVYSYIKFKRHYRLTLMFVAFMENKCRLNEGDIDALLSLCRVYTDAQLYKKAYDKYMSILHDPSLKTRLSEEKIEKVNENLRFCDAPLFWSSGPRDHFMFRYLHHFFLRRIGRRRFVFIREEDALEFNSLLRQTRFQ